MITFYKIFNFKVVLFEDCYSIIVYIVTFENKEVLNII